MATIERLLQSLLGQTYPTDKLEVVIADGMSTDSTREIIEVFSKQKKNLNIRVINNEARFIPHALNLAIRESTGDILIRMDAHSIPASDYVEHCVNALLENKGDNVGGLWNIQPSTETYAAKSIAIAACHPLGSGGANYRSGRKAQQVDTVPYGAYKRETFDRIGPYNESLLANEDYEWNMRLIANEGKVWFDPKINCIYFARSSYKALAKQYFNYGYWKVRMLQNFPKTLRIRQLLPPVVTLLFILSAIVSLVSILVGKPWGAAITLVLLIAYFGILGLSVAISSRSSNAHLLPGVSLGIACMHFSWGIGFLYSLLNSCYKKPNSK